MGITWTAAPPSTLLEVYLNDHLAGSRAGIELARRIRRLNQGGAVGRAMDELLPQLIEDRRTLEMLIDGLGLRRNPIKDAAGWAVEKVGRLKLNGQIRGYSDLSRLLELEALGAGVEAKHALWTTLEEIAERCPPVRAIDPKTMADRASSQLADIEEHRLAAARRAFARSAEHAAH